MRPAFRTQVPISQEAAVLLRRIIPPAAAMLALACAPSIQQDAPPASVTYAVFDPTVAKIPLPNDLALLPSSLAAFPPSAQRDLLTSFATSGGFPNDQEVAITLDFTTINIDPATGSSLRSIPELDLTTIAAGIKLIKLPGTPVDFAAPVDADYKDGTLTLHNKKDDKGNGPLPWPSSASGAVYALAVRGGQSGLKTKSGGTINPSATFYLLTRDLNLSDPANQGLIPGNKAAKAAAGAQLEQLRQGYLTPFAAVDAVFPHGELAVMATFHIAPTAAPHVETDPGRGLIPIPSDFLLKPDGKTVQLVPAFGALAPGLATLDGFSTTGPVIAQISGPILASTVNKNTVFVYDMSNPAAPVRVPDATEAGGVYVSEPPAFTQTISVGGTPVAVSTVIGLQPAIPVPTGNPLSPVLALPPFKENTEYVVMISNGVKDATNPAQGLVRSTLGSLLLFPPEHPLAAGGKSLVSPISDAQASGLENMRQLLHLAIAKLATDKGVTRDQVVMAYSFRTQSISGTGYLADTLKGVAAADRRPVGLIELAGLPYQVEQGANTATTPAFVFVPSPTIAHYTPAQAWTKWGLDDATPNSHIAEVVTGSTYTYNLLGAATGAFDPAKLAASPLASLEPIKFLLATPKYAATPACPAAYGAPPGTKCAPLVVFHHGFGGSKATMLAIANQYTKAGFIVAAIDGAKHGDRSWCADASDCNSGACVPIDGAATQGDAVPPGTCKTGGNKKFPTNCSTGACVVAWAGWTSANPTDPADGQALDSANYLVAANFFRTRDTFRQDVIDQSALILALARPPVSSGFIDIPNTNKALLGYLARAPDSTGGGGTIIDPGKVHLVGHSLGGILGTLNIAANPRISAGVIMEGGATIVDLFTNSPAFLPSVCKLLNGLGFATAYSAANPKGCDITDRSGYLTFLLVAKWILDPAEPINVAGNLLGGTAKPTLPDILSSSSPLNTNHVVVPQAAKTVLGQLAYCDGTVPNPFNLELFGQVGLGPKSATTSTVSLFANPHSADPTLLNCAGDFVSHSFPVNWGVSVTGVDTTTGLPTFATNPAFSSLAKRAQDIGALFLQSSNNLPPPLVTP